MTRFRDGPGWTPMNGERRWKRYVWRCAAGCCFVMAVFWGVPGAVDGDVRQLLTAAAWIWFGLLALYASYVPILGLLRKVDREDP